MVFSSSSTRAPGISDVASLAFTELTTLPQACSRAPGVPLLFSQAQKRAFAL